MAYHCTFDGQPTNTSASRHTKATLLAWTRNHKLASQDPFPQQWLPAGDMRVTLQWERCSWLVEGRGLGSLFVLVSARLGRKLWAQKTAGKIKPCVESKFCIGNRKPCRWDANFVPHLWDAIRVSLDYHICVLWYNGHSCVVTDCNSWLIHFEARSY